MHGLARQYVREKLKDTDDQGASHGVIDIALRHARYFSSHPVARYSWIGLNQWTLHPTTPAVREMLPDDLDNFSAGLQTALEYGD